MFSYNNLNYWPKNASYYPRLSRHRTFVSFGIINDSFEKVNHFRSYLMQIFTFTVISISVDCICILQVRFLIEVDIIPTVSI